MKKLVQLHDLIKNEITRLLSIVCRSWTKLTHDICLGRSITVKNLRSTFSSFAMFYVVVVFFYIFTMFYIV